MDERSDVAVESRPFSGRLALVTGASRGIGAAVALDLASRGASVLLLAHPDERDLLDSVTFGAGRMGVDARSLPVDLADSESVVRVMSDVVSTHGVIDFLVNNAFAMESGSVTDVSLDGWDHTLRVSLTGAMLMARLVIPGMLERGSGAIVNVSSQRAFAAGHGAAAYESAKAGLLALTRSIAVDYGSSGIRCNCLSPGFIRTERTQHWMDTHPQSLTAMAAAIPQGRPGRVDEIARPIAFLLSDDASFINGAVLSVDGGALAGLPENAALDLVESLNES